MTESGKLRDVDKVFMQIWEHLRASTLETKDVASLIAMIQANLLTNILPHVLENAEQYLEVVKEATLEVLAKNGWKREKLDA